MRVISRYRWILLVALLLACGDDDSEDPNANADALGDCQPMCESRECGDDGCGGTCGLCSASHQCSDVGVCICVPSCEGRVCGDDGCGGNCGDCTGNNACNPLGQCECEPKCTERECGHDGCGGSCGDCQNGFSCDPLGQCICEPDCTNKTCGNDGCGSVCGLCPADKVCTEAQQCGEPPKAPKIELLPAALQFGGQLVGESTTIVATIKSVGAVPLTLNTIVMGPGSNPNYVLGFDVPGGPASGQAPTKNVPVVLNPGTAVSFGVTYTPDIINPIGEDGKHILDTAEVRINSDVSTAESTLKLTGMGVETPCPKPVILNAQGASVPPQTVLKLFGDKSTSPQGEVVQWSWSVSPPVGASAQFGPNAQFPNPSLELTAVGTYTIGLHVEDSVGIQSCIPATYQVNVVPEQAIHVELLWKGLAGNTSDLDLHFVQQAKAQPGPDLDGNGLADGWFHSVYDCWQLNPKPNWGSFDPEVADNPILTRSDSDGTGPEIIQLAAPEAATYRIGAHYWNPNGSGEVQASIRVWVYGKLVFEQKDVSMKAYDLWDAVTLEWPSGNAVSTHAEGEPFKVTPNYINPDFPPP